MPFAPATPPPPPRLPTHTKSKNKSHRPAPHTYSTRGETGPLWHLCPSPITPPLRHYSPRNLRGNARAQMESGTSERKIRSECQRNPLSGRQESKRSSAVSFHDGGGGGDSVFRNSHDCEKAIFPCSRSILAFYGSAATAALLMNLTRGQWIATFRFPGAFLRLPGGAECLRACETSDLGHRKGLSALMFATLS
jgi:hypothetical protein